MPHYKLAAIAKMLEQVASRSENYLPAETLEHLKDMASDLREQYQHEDPCTDTACPCRAAEYEHAKDQGLLRP